MTKWQATFLGPAIGAGFSLALASDVIVASEKAYFLPSFVRLGLVPDGGSPFTWPVVLDRAAPWRH